MYQRVGDTLKETYRWTGLKADVMKHRLALPQLTIGNDLNVGSGFGREEIRRNIPEGPYKGPDFTGLLITKLGLNLTPDTASLSATTQGAIAGVLAGTSPLTRVQERLIKEYLARFIGRSATNPFDHALFLQLVKDSRVVLNSRTADALFPAGSGDPAVLQAFARAVTERLQRTPTDDEQFEFAGKILARLPTEVLAPHLPDMLAWSNDPTVRWNLEPLLTRFSDFGAVGAERLVFLVRDSGYGGLHSKGFAKREPYLAGLTGLCRMGSAAAAQSGDLLALARDGRIFFSDGRYGELAVHTLIRLGVAETEVRALSLVADAPMNATKLEREISRAKTEPECIF